MRVVIDTNVFVGACLGVGACNSVIKACLLHRCTPLMGTALFTEYEAVLGRQALFAQSRLDAAEREVLLDAFVALCEWTKVYYLWRPNFADESDNHLIELAVAGGAQYLVSRNLRDLQHSQMLFPSVRVISPESFLKESMP